MRMDEKRVLKALEAWARKVTNGYNDVAVTNMSSSWRNGLAFCAVIHHYRPDLIDFDSLSKENVLHNNSLAFSVAEKQLGVPALLDAEDMEKFSRLDTLSIITYLYQLYNCFENQNKSGHLKSANKRVHSATSSGPPLKISPTEKNISTGRSHDVCQKCKHRVFILERLIVDGKLYHRTCFKCCKCSSLLKPGAYVESEVDGEYECATCPHDELKETTSILPLATTSSGSDKPEKTIYSENLTYEKSSPIESPKVSLLSSSLNIARKSFLQQSISQGKNCNIFKLEDPSVCVDEKIAGRDEKIEGSEIISPKKTLSVSPLELEISVSVKDKISAFESGGSCSPSPSSEFGNNKKHSSLSLLSPSPDIDSLSNDHKPYQSVFLTKLRPKPLSSLKFDLDNSLLSRTKDKNSCSNSPVTPDAHKSNEDFKIYSYDLPVIKSPTYSSVTLPRPHTVTDFNSKGSFLVSSMNTNTKAVSGSSLNNIMHERWGKVHRRVSLESEDTGRQYKSWDLHSSESNKVSLNDLQPRKLHVSEVATGNLACVPDSIKISSRVGSNCLQGKIIDDESTDKSLEQDKAVDDKSTNNFLKQDKVIEDKSTNNSPEQGETLFTEQGETLFTEQGETLFTEQGETLFTEQGETLFTERRKTHFTEQGETLLTEKEEIFPTKIEEISHNSVRHLIKQRESAITSRTSVLSQYKFSISKSEENSTTTSFSENSVNSDCNIIEKENEAKNKLQTKKIKNHGEESAVKIKNTNYTDKSSLIAQTEIFFQNQDEPLTDTANLDAANIDAEKNYPDDLNPFGDSESEENGKKEESNVEDSYPNVLNPFGDSEEENDFDSSSTSRVDYDESLNPFASDDENECKTTKITCQPTVNSTIKSFNICFPVPAERTSIKKNIPSPDSTIKLTVSQALNITQSPTGSLRGTLKKRQAPRPPPVTELFRSESVISNSSNVSSLLGSSSPVQSVSKSPSPKLLKNKPAPLPPSLSPKTPNSSSIKHNSEVTMVGKAIKDRDNLKLKSSNQSDTVVNMNEESSTSPSKEGKRKKRPAPPVPIPARREIKKIPLKTIQLEMADIEIKQEELEKQGRELEILIRDRDKDEEPTVEEEELIMQLFELVNQKNALFRRQAELMYIKRSQKLEEEQVDLEYQIRCLMLKPASHKTENDVHLEEHLVQRLLDVVDQRNEIVDSIEMDRKREAVEDVSVQEQMDIKNSDLPITAEIKEKSAHKLKKLRKKEKKKQKQQQHSSGSSQDSEKIKKGTLHRMKWLQKET